MAEATLLVLSDEIHVLYADQEASAPWVQQM
jgi:hypothetical protein